MTAAATPAPASELLYATFDPDRLDALGDEELDALPFGVIALDSDGRIARYNMAEARFARLDRSQVVARSFFGEVARCTDTPEFRGRFDKLLAEQKGGAVRFEFVFAFRFGAQKVDIDMGVVSRIPVDAAAARVYLCINRRRFLPRQKDVPASIEAPLIAELEPDAEAAGVVRDEQARRRIEVDLTMLTALFQTLGRREGADASSVLRDWGTAWGRLAAVDLETESLEHCGKSLAELPMVGAMEIVARWFHRQKLGKLTFDYAAATRGTVTVRVQRSAFAEVAGGAGCAAIEGLIAAILSHLAARPIVVREASCGARTGEDCLHVAVSATRRELVERLAEDSRHEAR